MIRSPRRGVGTTRRTTPGQGPSSSPSWPSERAGPYAARLVSSSAESTWSWVCTTAPAGLLPGSTRKAATPRWRPGMRQSPTSSAAGRTPPSGNASTTSSSTAGRRVSECMVLIGDAKAEQGRLREAEKAYTAYLDKPEHKPHLREEEMDLRLALGTAKHRPERAIPLLQNLALRHRFAATGWRTPGTGVARGRLDTRVPLVPTRHSEPDALGRVLAALGLGGPRVGTLPRDRGARRRQSRATAWIAQSRSSFARSTRHPIPGTLQAVAEYRAPGGATGRRAWSIFEGWRKAGRWDKAAKWGQIDSRNTGSSGPGVASVTRSLTPSCCPETGKQRPPPGTAR